MKISPYRVGIRTCSDYSPFGVELDGRTVSVGYRYGFNGKEKTNEILGEGNSYDFGARMYDARVGRWLSCDPRESEVPFYNPFRFGFDNPIRYSDLNGEFEIEESVAKAYPNFTAYLKNLSVTYANKPSDFKKVFKQYSELTDEQISKMLEFKIVENGTKVESNQANPRIRIEQLTNSNGETPLELFKPDPTNPQKIKAKNFGIIKINKSIVDAYELDQTNSNELLLESTIFHESTHYGDALNGKMSQTTVSIIDGQIKIAKVNSINGSEGGKSFEKVVYGEDVNQYNCKQISSKLFDKKYGVKGTGTQPAVSTKVNNIIRKNK